MTAVQERPLLVQDEAQATHVSASGLHPAVQGHRQDRENFAALQAAGKLELYRSTFGALSESNQQEG